MGIKLISREEAFECNAALADSVISWQQAEYKDLQEDLDPDDLKHFERRLDKSYVTTPEFDFFTELKIGIKDSKLEGLISSFTSLLENLNIKELIFIPVYKDPWLRQKNNYPPVKKALSHIKDIVSDNVYNEGIQASGKDITELFLSVFWISRCNASMCSIYFSALDNSIVFSLCKYGVLHVYFYDEKEMEHFNLSLPNSGFAEVDDCFDIFDETAISGRQIIL